jgi:phosphomannomutase
MSKKKVDLKPETDSVAVLGKLQDSLTEGEVNTVDGMKIDFGEGWVHLRVSNTEPIIRVYSEAKTQKEADSLADQYVEKLLQLA